MPTLDVAQLRTDLRKHCGVTNDTDTGFDDATCDLLLNRSLWQLDNKFPFREKEVTKTFPTVVGVRLYAPPVLFEALRQLSIEDLTDQSHSTLDRATPFFYENNFVNNSDAQAKPTHYVREGANIRLWPTPDQIYTITYKHWITIADIDDTNPDFPLPKNWYEILLYGAVFRGFLQLRNSLMAMEFKNQQVALINDVVPVEAKEEIDSHRSGVSIMGYEADGRIYDSESTSWPTSQRGWPI